MHGTDPVRLVAVPDFNNQQTIDLLEQLLEEARAGRVIAITAVVEHRDGTYRTDGTATLSRLQTAGALMEAAMKRLQLDG